MQQIFPILQLLAAVEELGQNGEALTEVQVVDLRAKDFKIHGNLHLELPAVLVYLDKEIRVVQAQELEDLELLEVAVALEE